MYSRRWAGRRSRHHGPTARRLALDWTLSGHRQGVARRRGITNQTWTHKPRRLTEDPDGQSAGKSLAAPLASGTGEATCARFHIAVTTAGPLNSEPWGVWIAFVTLENPRTYEGQPQLARLPCGRRVEDSPSCIDVGSQQGLEPVQGHVIVEFVHTLLQMGHPELDVWK